MGERRPKIRRVDFFPDEYVAGTCGLLTLEEQGAYWMICAQIYSRGGPIPDNEGWLTRMFFGCHWRSIRAVLANLEAKGKIVRVDDQITVPRCIEELGKATTRVTQAAENGKLGGRPKVQDGFRNGSEPVQDGFRNGSEPVQDGLTTSREPNENNRLAEPDGSGGEKLTTNHQPPTIEEPPRPPEPGGAPLPEPEAKPKRRRASAGHATTLPDGFALDTAMRAYAERRCPGIDADAEFERFCNHHNGHESQFKNWTCAWQKWVLSPYAKIMKSQQQRSRVSEGYGFGYI